MAEEKENVSEKKKKKRKAGKKAAGAAVAFTAAVGVFFTSLFGSPNDLLVDPAANEPPAVVMEITEDEEVDEELEEQEEENTEKPGFFARIRMMILNLPLFVRVAVGLPLWALGWLVTQAFAALWKTFLAPVAGHILTFLIMAAVLLAVMTVLLKAVFPDLPLKEILSRPNILIVLISCVLFCVFNIVMDQSSPDFSRWEPMIRFTEGLFILLLVLLRTALRKRRIPAEA